MAGSHALQNCRSTIRATKIIRRKSGDYIIVTQIHALTAKLFRRHALGLRQEHKVRRIAGR